MVRVKLLEQQRAQAIALSGTSGGDNHSVYVHVEENAFVDYAGNPKHTGLDTVPEEVPDTVPPKVTAAAIDYTTGIVRITVDETVDSTPETRVDLSKILGVQTTGDTIPPDATVFSGASVTETDGLILQITLTEAQRVSAVRNSNTNGGYAAGGKSINGDGNALVADIFSGAFSDVARNPNVASYRFGLVEQGDVRNGIMSATMNYDTGVLTIQATETLSFVPASLFLLGGIVFAGVSGDTYRGV